MRCAVGSRQLILCLVRPMPQVVRVFTLSCLAVAFVGCSTLGPDPSIRIEGKSSLSWSDVREIERLLPLLGISRPIDGIYMEAPNRASVRCLLAPLSFDGDNEAITFTVERRNGRWVPVDRPSRGPYLFTA